MPDISKGAKPPSVEVGLGLLPRKHTRELKHVAKRVKLLSLGGTIAMVENGRGLANPALDAAALLERIPALKDIASVEVESYVNVPSPYLAPTDVLHVARRIEALAREGFDGVVITQGTDTLEETAYLLDLLISPSARIGVAVTGAQRNPSLVSADGPANLVDSLLTVADDLAPDMGVVVVFCSEVHAARDVVKTHTSRVDTFKSPETGPLGAITNGKVTWLRAPVVREAYQVSSEALEAPVEAIWSGMGTTSSLLDAAREAGARGVILQSLGAGHVTLQMIPGIKRLIDAGIPVVMTSRCHAGRLLTHTYGYEGSETHLHDLGVIFGDGLATSKARVKLMVLLAAGLTVEEIRREFEKNYY